MVSMGVTTVEAKSGYGLDVATEVKMLDVIDSLSKDADRKLRVVATFLGACRAAGIQRAHCRIC